MFGLSSIMEIGITTCAEQYLAEEYNVRLFAAIAVLFLVMTFFTVWKLFGWFMLPESAIASSPMLCVDFLLTCWMIILFECFAGFVISTALIMAGVGLDNCDKYVLYMYTCVPVVGFAGFALCFDTTKKIVKFLQSSPTFELCITFIADLINVWRSYFVRMPDEPNIELNDV